MTPPLPHASTSTGRPVVRDIAIRTGLIYVSLHAVALAVCYLPGTALLARVWNAVWAAAIGGANWAALDLHAFLASPVTSGDRSSDYLVACAMAAASLTAALVWTISVRAKPRPALSGWLAAVCRVYVGVVLCAFAAFKMLSVQYPPPSIEVLMTQWGDKSPMGVLWHTLGLAPGYNLFVGWVELTAGLMLFWRRTRALGAVLAAGTLVHTGVLFFTYDVPLKLFLLHVVAMALVLSASTWRRLFVAFVMGRALPAGVAPAMAVPRWLSHRSFTIAKTVALVAILGQQFGGAWIARAQAVSEPTGPLSGLYDVESFALDGVVFPDTVGDRVRWQNVIAERDGVVSIRFMDGRIAQFSLAADGSALTMTAPDGQESAFSTARVSPDTLSLRGRWHRHDAVVLLRRRDLSDYWLYRQKLRLIVDNTFPYNF